MVLNNKINIEAQKMENKEKENYNIRKRIQEVKDAEFAQKKAIRHFEKQGLEESMKYSRIRTQERESAKKEMREETRKRLKESELMMEMERKALEEIKRNTQAENNELLNLKLASNKKRKIDERKNDKLYTQSEYRLIETMLKKNEQFQDAIRHRLDKYEPCKKITENFNKESLETKKTTDYLLATKPYEDRLERELLEERKQLQEIQSRKVNLSHDLLKQIEKANLDKNMRLYKEMEEEHQIISKNIERLDKLEQERKMKVCNQIQATMDTLRDQITSRKEEIKNKTLMKKTEEGLNNPHEEEGYFPEKTVQYVPGYADQYDKALMEAYQNKNQSQDLKGDLFQPKSRVSFCAEIASRKRSLNIGKTSQPVSSQYEMIRNIGRNGVFNIITNSRF